MCSQMWSTAPIGHDVNHLLLWQPGSPPPPLPPALMRAKSLSLPTFISIYETMFRQVKLPQSWLPCGILLGCRILFFRYVMWGKQNTTI